MATKGSKKSPLTKEEMERQIRLADSRKLIIERFYPALKEATESIDEAGMLLQAANAIMMEEAMEALRTTKIRDVRSRMLEKLCPNKESLLAIENLLSIFNDRSLFETRGHFESMSAVLRQIQRDEMMSRGLDTFKPDWERYLNR